MGQRPFNLGRYGSFLLAAIVGIALTQLSPWLSLVGLLGTAVLLLILRYPLAGLGLSLLFGPFGALESLFLGITLFDSGQIFLLLALSSWLLRSLHQKSVILPRRAFYWPLLLFMGIALLSIIDAPSLTLGIRELIKWLEMGLIMLLILSERARFSSLSNFVKLIIVIFLASGLVQALVGIWQFGLRGTGPEHFIISGNLYRAYGTFEQPNPFGGLMHMTALLAVGVATTFLRPFFQTLLSTWHKWRTDRRIVFTAPPLFNLFVLACGATAVLSLLFSWSRGAWLGFAAGGAALAFFWPNKRWIGVIGIVGIGLLVGVGWQFDLLPASITNRLVGFAADFQLGDVRGLDINDANYSVLERLAHWQAATGMAQDNLWLGVGFGNYEPAYADYDLINWPDPLGHAHNYYLNILAEMGVTGLLAYALFWGVVIWQTMKLIHTQEGLYRGVALGLMACWTAVSVHHLVDKLFVNNLYIHFGVLLGLMRVLYTEKFEKRSM